MTTPIIYTDTLGDIPFRSSLERKVAMELDRLQVEWAYERPVVLDDGTSPYYLPDFTIFDAYCEQDLQLPRWVEVKPMNFLYDVRQHCGVDRQYSDKFSGEVPVRGVDSNLLKSWGSELWKPKRLAEVSGQPVLAVGGVGGTNLLSILLADNELVFRRDHPFVNQAGVERKRLRAEREEQARLNQERWERERERRQRECEAMEATLREAGLVLTRRLVEAAKQQPAFVKRNRYEQPCRNCGKTVPVNTGSLHHVPDPTGRFHWIVLCWGCRQ